MSRIPVPLPLGKGNKKFVSQPHLHLVEAAACPVAVRVYIMTPLLLLGGVEMSHVTNPSPLPGGDQICGAVTPLRRLAGIRVCHGVTPLLCHKVGPIPIAVPSQVVGNLHRPHPGVTEHCLLDLPDATRQERVKMIWKTTSRSVQAFIESQPPLVRDSFSRLSRALIEEFSPFANETTATISALQIRHRRSETPKEFYNRLKHAFFQGRNEPASMCDSSATLYSPRITGGIQANGVAVQEVIVALWSEKSAVRQDLYDIIRQNDANLPFVQKSHRLLSAELPQAPVKSIGVCALTLQIGGREFVHYVSVTPHLSHSFYIGVDILVRPGAQLDMINQVVWSQANIGRNKLTAQPEQMCSGQTVPLACQVASEFDVVIPSRTTRVPLRLMILRGQELDSTQTFFQPSPHLFELNIMVRGSPLLEVANRSVYLLVQNLTHRATQVTARKPLGYLIDSSYHDFELTIPIIGELPNSLREFENGEGVYLTHPTNMIAIFPQEPIQSSTVCHVDLGVKVGMVLHTSTMTPNASSSGDAGTLLLEEPYLDFESEVQQQLSRADALKGDAQRQELQSLFYDFKHLFSRDSSDCGVTDLHTVRIPMDPGAPPTFVHQYRIPLAAFESIQEILDSLLDKNIICECNSTYNSPLWPMLKPSGKWRLTIDYRQLNKQIPVSRWPMIHLDQELAKVTNAQYFSTVDVSNGFWTMKVDPADQYKLAFSFGNLQFTWNRCPFGYSNSPAEFNIFLHKAMSDATMRGNLIYVDDILMRSQTWDAHLAELRHVLNQRSTAGAKLSLTKGQWCQTKVEYVGLLVGANGVEPQSGRCLSSHAKPDPFVPPVESWWKEMVVLGTVGCASAVFLLLSAIICYKAIKRKPLRKEENGTREYAMSSRSMKTVDSNNTGV
ncbi:hypothetical protein SKAU_G00191020 [Synaphobranchus kaupii]|uniref:ribonuclease H n=1 Tax=Synaphobranchus kaupii TaxID=118154 RepID=A0A9Q1FE19_SYNKA|nr:hypothetical protein SKAU_G00191020 [Synaphobranchus kaupii]